ncbi:MAG: hypothetical protein LBT88_07620 [Oscillospiraceae bacterium]|jgi:hypothetical protein|nr:hypothetical protein [Oscillospiraceae bacterium]
MEYNNIYKGNGEVIRVPKPPRQGPPTSGESQNIQAAETQPAARPAVRTVSSSGNGDLLLMAVLLLLWIERRDEEALLTLIALLMI